MKTLIIGVGGTGNKIITLIPPKRGREFIAVDRFNDTQPKLPGHIKTIDISKVKDKPSSSAVVGARKTLTTFYDEFKGFTQLIVVANVGGSTSMQVAPLIAAFGNMLWLKATLFAVLPFSHEGSRYIVAKEAINDFIFESGLEGPHVITLNNDALAVTSNFETAANTIEQINLHIAKLVGDKLNNKNFFATKKGA